MTDQGNDTRTPPTSRSRPSTVGSASSRQTELSASRRRAGRAHTHPPAHLETLAYEKHLADNDEEKHFNPTAS